MSVISLIRLIFSPFMHGVPFMRHYFDGESWNNSCNNGLIAVCVCVCVWGGGGKGVGVCPHFSKVLMAPTFCLWKALHISVAVQLCTNVNTNTTRKLCYRKDDRAMRPIHGCPENFRDSLTTSTATIPNIFHGLLFGSTLWMFLQKLKSVALSVPQIIGGTPKTWSVPGYALAPFSRKFLIGFYSDWPYKCTRQICSPYLYPVPR